MDTAVFFNNIQRTETVLNDHQRNMISFVHLAEGNTQAHRVDLPAPSGSFQIRVLSCGCLVAFRPCSIRVCGGSSGHVVGEADIVDNACFDQIKIAVFHLDIDTETLEFLQLVVRIVSLYLNIDVEFLLAHFFDRLHDIIRVACQRIYRCIGDHHADLVFRIDLVSAQNCFCGSDKNMVVCLIAYLRFNTVDTQLHPGSQDVDLIECHPVAYSALEVGKEDLSEVDEVIDQFSAVPAVQSICQIHRNIEVCNGNDRFNTELQAFVNDCIIESKSFFIDFFHAVRNDSRPAHGETEGIHAHFRKQRDIFLIVMIEIGCLMGRIINIRDNIADSAFRQ